jgi:cytochrome b561
MRTERDGFSGLQRVLHWLMAIMVLTMLFIGVSMVSTLEPRFLTLITIHKPLGIAILALAALRLAVRSRLGAPPLPDDLPRIQALAAKLSHFMLYALLIAMPLVGWGMLSAGGYPVVRVHPSHSAGWSIAVGPCGVAKCIRPRNPEPLPANPGAAGIPNRS